jgi:hypothetical protein
MVEVTVFEPRIFQLWVWFSQLFYDTQIYTNKVLNTYNFKNGTVFKIKNLKLKTY